ncbi:MAG: gas vesicle protein GvpG [Solirubrobacteraceae bacterium]
MGLFTSLITLPLAPVRGVAWVAEQVMEEMERELYDEESIRRELVQLELEFEDGLIDEEERQMREDALLERLAVGGAYPLEETDG